jgi:hypothetical protein
MWKFLLGAWALASVCDNKYEKRKQKYNQAVANHRRLLDEKIANYIRLIRLDPIAEQGMADGLAASFHIFSQEDIVYILDGISVELPEAADRIFDMFAEMPVLPEVRGYGIEFV